ncbi:MULTISPECIES: hypothetical protein [unclassified Microcoleus]|jgi:hypothetical protein|uniref:hypothetical protein n=1 Tax=unclassified Microcoleus TaxID=2642155 RepID=UPI002FD5CC2A
MVTNKTHIAVSLDLGTSIPSSVRAADASNLVLKIRHENELEKVRAQNQQLVEFRSQVEATQAASEKLKVQQVQQLVEFRSQVETTQAASEKLKFNDRRFGSYKTWQSFRILS